MRSLAALAVVVPPCDDERDTSMMSALAVRANCSDLRTPLAVTPNARHEHATDEYTART
jgi:hypothetical protein